MRNWRIIGVGLLGLILLLSACGSNAQATATETHSTPTRAVTSQNVPTSVHITRTTLPGRNLPPLDSTLTNPSTVQRLFSEAETLPDYPIGVMSCPIDIGPYYTLQFFNGQKPTVSMKLDVTGCPRLTISTQSAHAKRLSTAFSTLLAHDLAIPSLRG